VSGADPGIVEMGVPPVPFFSPFPLSPLFLRSMALKPARGSGGAEDEFGAL